MALFAGTNFKLHKLPKNAQTPTTRVLAFSQGSGAPWNDGSSFVTKETVAQKYTPNEQV